MFFVLTCFGLTKIEIHCLYIYVVSIEGALDGTSFTRSTR